MNVYGAFLLGGYIFSSTTITLQSKSYAVRLCLKTNNTTHSGNSKEINEFFISDLKRAMGNVKGRPGYKRTVGRSLFSTGITAVAVTTRRPSRALPGVAPPVRPMLPQRQNA